jgi:hypothetical protein
LVFLFCLWFCLKLHFTVKMMLLNKIRMVLFLSVVYSLLAAVFSACSRDEHPDSKPVEILVSTGFGPVSGVETRGEGSIYEKDILSEKPLSLSVVRIDQTSESDDAYLPYTATVADGVGAPRGGRLTRFNTDIRMAFDDKAYYLSREHNNKTKLIGWYPAVGDNGGSVWAVDGSGTATVSFTVDGETDVLMSDLVEGSKDKPFLNNNKMTFSHLLTRFRVRVYTFDTAVEGQFGKIKSITLAGKAQTCVAQLPAVSAVSSGATPETTFTGGDNLPLIHKDPADNTAITYPLSVPLLNSAADNGPTVGLAGYAMVAPVAKTDQVILNIETENQGTKTVKIPAPDTAPNADGFAAGKSYTLALEFNTKGIEFVNVTILDWAEEEEINTNVL